MTWNATDYSANSTAQTRWARDLLASLALSGSETVLDIGCGDGRITAEIAARLGTGRVLGVDLSREMIDLARRTWSGVRGLEFRVMDAARLDLGERFDVAFSNAALHWVADHPAVLSAVRGCLVGGGRILFQMGGRGNASEVQRVVDEVRSRPAYRDRFQGFVAPYHFHDVDEYMRWLPEAGFRPRRVELLPRDMRHDGVQGLRGWLRTTWFPYTDRLPAAERDGFWDAVLDRYTAHHPLDAEGGTHVSMVRLEVEAVAVTPA